MKDSPLTRMTDYPNVCFGCCIGKDKGEDPTTEPQELTQNQPPRQYPMTMNDGSAGIGASPGPQQWGGQNYTG